MRFTSLSRSAPGATARSAPKPGWLTLWLFPALLACGSDDDDPPKGLPGEIGSNHFFYECATIDDPQCREEQTNFPEKIAVGARFDLEASTSQGSSLSIEAASPLLIAPSTGEFVFLRPGVTAFLAMRDRQVHDFAHLRGVEVASLRVHDVFGERVSALVLTSGQRTSLTVVPFDDEGDTLAGSLTYRWVTDNEAAILIQRTGTTVNIHGQEPGAAQVRVSLGDTLSLMLNVVVTEKAQNPIEDGGRDAGGDAQMADAQVPWDSGTTTGDAATSDTMTGDAATSMMGDAASSPPTDTGATLPTNDTNSGASIALDAVDAGVQP